MMIDSYWTDALLSDCPHGTLGRLEYARELGESPEVIEMLEKHLRALEVLHCIGVSIDELEFVANFWLDAIPDEAYSRVRDAIDYLRTAEKKQKMNLNFMEVSDD